MSFKLKYFKYGLPVLFLILFLVIAKTQNRTACTIIPTPAIINASDVDGSTVNLSWKNGQNSKITYLNVSASKSLKPDGSSLETADIVNDVVTDRSSYLKSNLKPGTYYWNIVSDGCGQRRVSELSSFTIQSTANANCEVAPAVLGTPIVKDSNATFNWTNDLNPEASYINVSSSKAVSADGVLQNADIANDVVSGKASFTKENLSPGIYYWYIINDSCGQRKMSELGTFTIE